MKESAEIMYIFFIPSHLAEHFNAVSSDCVSYRQYVTKIKEKEWLQVQCMTFFPPGFKLYHVQSVGSKNWELNIISQMFPLA